VARYGGAYGDVDLPLRERPAVVVAAVRQRKRVLDEHVRGYLAKSAEMGYTVYTGDSRTSHRPVSHDDRLREILEAHEWADELLGIAQRAARELAHGAGR
jgi:hypothetical protein